MRTLLRSLGPLRTLVGLALARLLEKKERMKNE
jgi:hypothetical protein